MKTAFSTVKEAAAQIGIDPGNLQKYMRESGTEPGWKVLNALWGAGCNVRWLMDEQGSMFADNEAGKALEKRVVRRSNATLLPHFTIGQRVPDRYPDQWEESISIVQEPVEEVSGYTKEPQDSALAYRVQKLEEENQFLRGKIAAYEHVISTLTPGSHGHPPTAPASGED